MLLEGNVIPVKNKFFQLLVIRLFLLTGCARNKPLRSYDEMKKMMTDALQTEDGKKAIRQMLADPEFRELLILEQPEVKKSIEETLLSKKGKSFGRRHLKIQNSLKPSQKV